MPYDAKHVYVAFQRIIFKISPLCWPVLAIVLMFFFVRLDDWYDVFLSCLQKTNNTPQWPSRRITPITTRVSIWASHRPSSPNISPVDSAKYGVYCLLFADRKAHRNGIKKPIRKVHESTLGVSIWSDMLPLLWEERSQANAITFHTNNHADGRQVRAQPAICPQG